MKKRIVALFVAVCALSSFVACGDQKETSKETKVAESVETVAETTAETETAAETETIVETTVETAVETEVHGEEKTIVVEVVDAEGTSTVFEVETEAEVLYDAIQNVEGFTIDGYEGDYGFFITAINGIEPDYEKDGAYWALYVNDEYAELGVSSLPVENGNTYSFKYEVYQAQ